MDQLEFLLFDLKHPEETIDYNTLDRQNKQFLQQTIITIQLMKIILEKPLMTEEGKIQPSSAEYINALPNNQKVLELL